MSLDTVKYATEIEVFKEELKSRFKDVRKQSFYIFLAAFTVNVKAVLERYQMDLMDLHGSEEIEYKFLNPSLLKLQISRPQKQFSSP